MILCTKFSTSVSTRTKHTHAKRFVIGTQEARAWALAISTQLSRSLCSRLAIAVFCAVLVALKVILTVVDIK